MEPFLRSRKKLPEDFFYRIRILESDVRSYIPVHYLVTLNFFGRKVERNFIPSQTVDRKLMELIETYQREDLMFPNREIQSRFPGYILEHWTGYIEVYISCYEYRGIKYLVYRHPKNGHVRGFRPYRSILDLLRPKSRQLSFAGSKSLDKELFLEVDHQIDHRFYQ